MTLKKLKTDKENLVFVGYDGFEEFYLDLSEYSNGWSFIGLRPATEEELRELSRETTPEELGYNLEGLERYFDYDAFLDDMEEGWYERHDVQAEREEDGETIYLGFGTGTNMDHYFKERHIKTYNDFLNNFNFVGLTEEDFETLTKNKPGFISKIINEK